jgi:hypothetical protein
LLLFDYFSRAGFLLLVFFPAPAALGQFLYASLFDDAWPQAVMGLLRGDVVDAGMVMLGVIPGKVATEVFVGLGIIEKATGIGRGAFDVKADLRRRGEFAPESSKENSVKLYSIIVQVFKVGFCNKLPMKLNHSPSTALAC